MVYIVYYIWHGLLCKVGNGKHGCHLHLFVDGGSVHVEGSAEDVWETDHIVYLIWIVGASGRHQNVGAAVHSVLIAYFRYGVGEGEHDGLVGH